MLMSRHQGKAIDPASSDPIRGKYRMRRIRICSTSRNSKSQAKIEFKFEHAMGDEAEHLVRVPVCTRT